MDLYTFSLLLGGVGLAAMGLNSVSHHAGGRGHSARAGGSRAGRGHGRASQGHGKTGHAPARADGQWQHLADAALALLSPRLLFSALLGFGLAGMLLRSFLGGALLLVAAVCGGLLFEWLLVGPLWNFLLRFASNPATTLESCVTDDATAVTGFDREGQGLVAVEVDGQVVQVLGTLTELDRTAGRKVRAGDRVRIEEVDAARNRCVVSVP
ncbi:MAG TPA: hypothetical protein VMJ30_01600 [Gemmatimonadales bacterium]|nr:hypothetical protein [Gemmatimonadales bacterium]